MPRKRFSAGLIPLLLATVRGAPGYSVLSPEAIIDAVWDQSIRPIPVARFPEAPPDDIRKAHSYASGGDFIFTYEDDPDHLKTEFSFDVSQVAENHNARPAYHELIGFGGSEPLQERAFPQTYGMSLTDVSKTLELALGTYRRTVSAIVPEMTKVAWDAEKKELRKATPGLSRRRFVYAISRSRYEKEWGTGYQNPGFRARCPAFRFRLVPQVGPFHTLGFRPDTPEAPKLFMESFTRSLAVYRGTPEEVREGSIEILANHNFDTAKVARLGACRLTDKACGELILKLKEKKFVSLDGGLRKGLLAFYGNARPQDPPVQAALAELRAEVQP